MFSDPKVAVLESKINIYEDLSREMLAKLEAAVEKISEGNNRIAQILTKHDERIEQTMKSDELIIKMIEELKEEINDIDKGVKLKFHDQNKKIEEAQKWIWMAGAVLTTAVTLLQVLPNMGLQLTPTPKTSMMGAEVVRSIG